MAFDKSCTKAVLSASPGPTPKRCELPLFLASLGQIIRCSKAVDLGSWNMQFQHDWPKEKKITALLIFWPENLEKYRSTELYAGKNSMRSCHCAKSVDSQWGANRCEQVWTGVNRCEKVWKGVNRCDEVWTGMNRWEQVWTTVFPRWWVAHSKFCLPFDEVPPSVHFPTAFKRPRNTAGLASQFYQVS